MTMVIFSNGPVLDRPSHIQVGSWNQFLALSCEPDGFWIDASWPGAASQLAAQLRASPWWDRLAFTAGPCAEPLLDGQAELDDATRRCARAQLAKASLAPNLATLLPAEKLLLYLSIRDKYELLPRYSKANKGAYAYPLAEALGAGEPDHDWFEQLVRGHLLTPVRLVDRIRTCPDCGSAHLSYVDVCPACSSIELRHTPALHCFTCGHVARKSDFDAGGHLTCPRCDKRLRHIGADYDAPMAQYLCGQCQNVALEPRVVATCFDCRHSHEPGKLQVREIQSYALNWQGQEALREGQLHGAFHSASGGAHMHPAQFRQMLQWSTLAQQRHAVLSFSVFLIEVDNIDALLAWHGAHAVHPMLHECASRLRAGLRVSDVTCLDSAERLWVLLPFAAPAAAGARLLALAEQMEPAGGPRLTLRLNSLHAPHELARNDGPDAIMARLLDA
jgi:hypothetical protein